VVGFTDVDSNDEGLSSATRFVTGHKVFLF
jgi:hypothetical protein